MGLSEFDRELLDKCLNRQAGSWEHFTDRFGGLMMAVTVHVADSRNIRTSVMDREDVVARIFSQLIEDDFRILRNFRGNASLYTYLTVISRRVAVRELIKLDRKQRKEKNESDTEADLDPPVELDREDFDELIATLDDVSSKLVRMRYVQGLPYSEIARQLNLEENSIGPMLSRARASLKKTLADSES